MKAIYHLGNAAMEALEARGTDEYEEKLFKIPVELRNKLIYVIQWIAMILLVIFECRRGQENIHELKKADFVVFNDSLKELEYIKHDNTHTETKLKHNLCLRPSAVHDIGAIM